MPFNYIKELSGETPATVREDRNLYRLEIQIQTNRKRIADNIVRVSKRAAEIARDTMKAGAPVDSGALKASIRINKNNLGTYRPGGFTRGDTMGRGSGAGGGLRVSEVLIGNSPGQRTQYRIAGPAGLSQSSSLYEKATTRTKEVYYARDVIEGSPAIPVRYETATSKSGKKYRKAKALVWPNPKKDDAYHKNWEVGGRKFGIAYSRRARAANRLWVDEGIREANRYINAELNRLDNKYEIN